MDQTKHTITTYAGELSLKVLDGGYIAFTETGDGPPIDYARLSTTDAILLRAWLNKILPEAR